MMSLPFLLAIASFVLAPLQTRPDSVHVGLASITVVDSTHGDTIRAALWYPTRDAERDTSLAAQLLHVAPNGRYLASAARRPLILVSHGTGGDQYGHWDTAEALARAGFVVATIRHVGDNPNDHSALGSDRYLYGRPTQIEALLNALVADSDWSARIDTARIGFFGFSAGGFTGLELLGARPRLDLLLSYCGRHPTDDLYCASGLHGRFTMTGRYDPPRRDPRIRAAALWAPAFAFLFDSRSLASVKAPLLIVRAALDSVVIEPDNVAHLTRALPRPPQLRVVPRARHYTLLAPCGPTLARLVPDICTDLPGVSRTAVHDTLDAELVAFFARRLR
jgi:predicted dienelactone hydrolase